MPADASRANGGGGFRWRRLGLPVVRGGVGDMDVFELIPETLPEIFQIFRAQGLLFLLFLRAEARELGFPRELVDPFQFLF
jgi:hypothetical protein